MNRYSWSSRSRLNTCDPRLIQVMEAVLPVFDHKILEGARDFELQRHYFETGVSKTMASKHVVDLKKDPEAKSKAVDVVPYPHRWDFEKDLLEAYKDGDLETAKAILHSIQRWAMFIGHVLQAAHDLGVKIRSGADWDGDKDLADQNFDDWPHFELV